MKIKTGILCLCVLLFSIVACGYMSISKRDDAYEKPAVPSKGKAPAYNSAVLMGRVDLGRATAIMIMALNAARDREGPGEYVIMEQPGQFMLYVPEGDYRVYAFADADENGVFTDDEICGTSGGPGGITVKAGEVASGIEIRAAAPGTKPSRKIFIRDDGAVPHQTGNGDIVAIYNEKFCMKNAETGWWAPSVFMKAFGANIYFARKYDPQKIPVLFVHGAQGSPQNWAYFHFRLNTSRYQPWYYYYPSGIRLSLASRLLYESLIDLKKKYGFTKICITAHSIGGLITRYLLAHYDLKRHGIEVRLFATLASPWTGFESADWALRLPTKKLPSWFDVATHSEFVRRALEGHLPPSVCHHLFYGKGDTVAKGRALDERVYMEAKGKHGFDVNHDTILIDRNVFRKFNEVLSFEMAR